MEQYSQQQALVMQGKVDEALQSFEAIIGTAAGNVDARIKAAGAVRVRPPRPGARRGTVPAGAAHSRRRPRLRFYVSNRLVDLLVGPLADPGRAMVELRRLIERHPGTTAASHARATRWRDSRRRAAPRRATSDAGSRPNSSRGHRRSFIAYSAEVCLYYVPGCRRWETDLRPQHRRRVG